MLEEAASSWCNLLPRVCVFLLLCAFARANLFCECVRVPVACSCKLLRPSPSVLDVESAEELWLQCSGKCVSIYLSVCVCLGW